jgi:hypothetical protein
MGNGASVTAPASRQPYERYSDLKQPSAAGQDLLLLEKRSQKNYYRNHPEEYREEVIEAIKTDDIGTLEILMKCSDISILLPLHLAVKYSSLESLELLLSAGCSPLAIDKNGATPLHRAVGITKEGSLLCLHSLLLHSPKSVNLRDIKGNTPLHLAITASNLLAVEILLTSGASWTLTNAAGCSSRALAKSLKAREVVEMIDCMKAGRPLPTRQPTKPPPTPAEMERIMKVWERFFENALSGIDFHEGEVEEGEEEGLGGYSEHGDSHEQVEDLVAPAQSEEVFSDACCWWFGYVLCYDEGRIQSQEAEAEAGEPDSSPGAVDGYYVSSTLDLSEQPLDLDDHLYSQEQHQLWGGYSVAAQETEEGEVGGGWLPATTAEAIRRGWMVCFLSDSNECVWLNLLSYSSERYLPIGWDEWSGWCGCEREEGDEEGYWVRPPQVTARAWLMVRCTVSSSGDQSESKGVCLGEAGEIGAKSSLGDERRSEKLSQRGAREEGKAEEKLSARRRSDEKREGKAQGRERDEDDEADRKGGSAKEGKVEEGEQQEGEREVWYFHNRVSGESRWDEPMGWSEIVSLAGGWVLCAEESRMEELYWWSQTTGDIVWYGEEYE